MDFRQLRKTLTSAGDPSEPLHAQLDGQSLRMLTSHAHGECQRWLSILGGLPEPRSPRVTLTTDAVTVDCELQDQQALKQAVLELGPWRKGPYRIGDLHIDSEWQCQMKWARLARHVDFLGRHVLDVGAGNGYYALRALGAGARSVLGIDPGALCVAQFEAIKHFAGPLPAWVLPLRDDELPADLACFDTVMSMGVLYHQGAPFPHLRTLRNALRPGGQLVLETLVSEGDAHHAFVPEDRYAGMRNVYFLPSTAALSRWLARAGFAEPRCVDITPTTPEEQRSTEFCPGQSLSDFLDPDDPRRTREGHPAPTRALLLATRP